MILTVLNRYSSALGKLQKRRKEYRVYPAGSVAMVFRRCRHRSSSSDNLADERKHGGNASISRNGLIFLSFVATNASCLAMKHNRSNDDALVLDLLSGGNISDLGRSIYPGGQCPEISSISKGKRWRKPDNPLSGK